MGLYEDGGYMIKGRRVLAIIPARGGSKGLPGKNIKDLNGKPLIAWTIDAAEKSKYIDKVVVSTDDAGIANIAKKYGAEVPFVRPKHLASDKAKMIDVVLHCVDFFRKAGEFYDNVILLQATSPLRSTDDIDEAIRYFAKKNAQAVISVVECEHSPLFAGTLPRSNSMAKFIPKNIMNKNRQQLGGYYRLNGAIYIAKVKYLLRRKNFLGSNAYAYIMPKERSIDIDNAMDFEFAKFSMLHMSGGCRLS